MASESKSKGHQQEPADHEERAHVQADEVLEISRRAGGPRKEPAKPGERRGRQLPGVLEQEEDVLLLQSPEERPELLPDAPQVRTHQDFKHPPLPQIFPQSSQQQAITKPIHNLTHNFQFLRHKQSGDK